MVPVTARGIVVPAGAAKWHRWYRPAMVGRAAWKAAYALGAAWWVAVLTAGGMIASDARVYWAGAHAAVTGGDPWAAGHNGWHFGSFPPTALLFAPAGLLPEPVFVAAWMAATVAAAAYIVRVLELDRAWLLYPPLVMGVLLGNPIVVATALVLGGRGVLGTLVRPQHAIPALVVRPRALVGVGAVSLVSLVVFPGWFAAAPAIMTRYASESGPAINAWGSAWILPVGALVGALASRDMRLAAWLLPAAVMPAAGFYSAIALMVARRPATATLGAVPVPGAMALGCAAECAWQLGRAAWPSAGRGRRT